MFWSKILICLVLGILCYMKKVFDFTGSLSAFFVGLIVLFSTDFSWFFLLLSFVFFGYLSTRYKYDKKKSMNVAEGDSGRRSWRNVMGNGLIPTIMAVTGNFHGYLGAVSTALADTLAAEIGVLSKTQPRLITNPSKIVPHGTDGGVTLLGTTMGIIGASFMGIFAYVLFHNLYYTTVALLSGFIGCMADSVLGALLERNGYITGDVVNICATSVGAFAGIFVARGI
ncbi:MAG: TIGR00297 family protein [Candidatus Hydrothermarchaeota archaeon]